MLSPTGRCNFVWTMLTIVRFISKWYCWSEVMYTSSAPCSELSPDNLIFFSVLRCFGASSSANILFTLLLPSAWSVRGECCHFMLDYFPTILRPRYRPHACVESGLGGPDWGRQLWHYSLYPPSSITSSYNKLLLFCREGALFDLEGLRLDIEPWNFPSVFGGKKVGPLSIYVGIYVFVRSWVGLPIHVLLRPSRLGSSNSIKVDSYAPRMTRRADLNDVSLDTFIFSPQLELSIPCISYQ